MGLSSNTLWHQTDYPFLKKIIKDRKFKLRFSVEDLKSASPFEFKFAFPMISFSDIPISEYNTHLNKYGGFSIGMSREWIEGNQFTPVLYYGKNSILLRDVVERVVFYRVIYDSLSDFEKTDFNIFLYNIAHAKNYQGFLKTSYTEYENYRFSDEREWRFVPQISEFDNIYEFYYDPTIYKKSKIILNDGLKGAGIQFDLKDIRYIIAKTEYQIFTIKKLLQKSFQKQIPSNGWDGVNINFFTHKQIKNDIFGIAHNVAIIPTTTTS